jgi:hypothetical protein
VTISPVNSFEPVFLKVPMVAIVSLRFPFRARTIAASMAIGWPEAIDGAPRRGLTAKEGFLVSRGMAAQPAGEESLTRLLRHRRSRL